MGIEVKTRNAQLVEIECYECPCCETVFNSIDGALNCCGGPNTVKGYKCTECGEFQLNNKTPCCVEEYKICTQCGCETHLDRCCEELF